MLHRNSKEKNELNNKIRQLENLNKSLKGKTQSQNTQLKNLNTENTKLKQQESPLLSG